MKRKLLILLLTSWVGAVLAAPQYVISGEQWLRPRQATDLLADSGLRAVLARFDANAGNRLVIHYPGGEEGSLWAHDLLTWLVALGVPSARIELVAGGVSEAALGIDVAGPTDRDPSMESRP